MQNIIARLFSLHRRFNRAINDSDFHDRNAVLMPCSSHDSNSNVCTHTKPHTKHPPSLPCPQFNSKLHIILLLPLPYTPSPSLLDLPLPSRSLPAGPHD